MEKMTLDAAKELLRNTTKLTKTANGQPVVVHSRDKYVEALHLLAGAHLGPPPASIYRQNLAAQLEQSNMAAPDKSDILEELEKPNSIISAESVAAAEVTPVADTPIEQKSWWSALKALLRL